jgi:hypothetical protein
VFGGRLCDSLLSSVGGRARRIALARAPATASSIFRVRVWIERSKAASSPRSSPDPRRHPRALRPRSPTRRCQMKLPNSGVPRLLGGVESRRAARTPSRRCASWRLSRRAPRRRLLRRLLATSPRRCRILPNRSSSALRLEGFVAEDRWQASARGNRGQRVFRAGESRDVPANDIKARSFFEAPSSSAPRHPRFKHIRSDAPAAAGAAPPHRQRASSGGRCPPSAPLGHERWRGRLCRLRRHCSLRSRTAADDSGSSWAPSLRGVESRSPRVWSREADIQPRGHSPGLPRGNRINARASGAGTMMAARRFAASTRSATVLSGCA